MTSPVGRQDDQAVAETATREVAIVGAGAVGSTAAYELARRGAEVTVYEQGPVAAASSSRAAGICYDAVTDEPAATLAREAVARFRTLSGPETFDFQPCPYVWFAREDDTEGGRLLDAGISQMTGAERLDPDDLSARYPAMRTDDVAVAGITEGAGYVDPASARVYDAGSAREEGAKLQTETAVAVERGPARVVRPDGSTHEPDAVLLAAGAHSKQLLADAGLSIAMKPYRVQALVAPFGGTMPMWYDTTAGCYARPHPDGLLAGDGTEEVEADPDAYDRDGDGWFQESTTAWLADRVEEFEPTVSEAWAGLCTATPDRQPLVGRVETGLYLATGFQGQGFMRSPAVGRRIAEQMLGGEGIPVFDPLRFDGNESFAVREGMSVADGRDSETE